MNVLEGIHSRHSIGKVKPEAIPRELIETMIDAAVQAPNHRLTEPWKFFVLQGQAREELGKLMGRTLLLEKPGAAEPDIAKEALKPMRAPVIIAITSDAGEDPVTTTENFAATAAAAENLLLAAHELGLAAMWRTGDAAYAAETKTWLGIPDATSVVAFVYIGYADMEPKPRRRIAAREKTEWRD